MPVWYNMLLTCLNMAVSCAGISEHNYHEVRRCLNTPRQEKLARRAAALLFHRQAATDTHCDTSHTFHSTVWQLIIVIILYSTGKTQLTLTAIHHTFHSTVRQLIIVIILHLIAKHYSVNCVVLSYFVIIFSRHVVKFNSLSISTQNIPLRHIRVAIHWLWSGCITKVIKYGLFCVHCVVPTTQFAYRKGLGTCDALLCVSHALQSALESGH